MSYLVKGKYIMKFENDLRKALQTNKKEEIEKVFENIYYEYYRLVKYISINIVKRDNSAEDIAQETFLHFFQKIKEISITNIKYYLVQTSKNLSLNYIKRKENSNIVNEEVVMNQISIYDDETNKIIESLYNTLDKENADRIILHLIYNFTFKEISHIENKNINTIKSKYRIAVKKYKQQNKEEKSNV